MDKIPKQIVVVGDSGVLGWGDSENGGWCEMLRRKWMKLPQAPVIYPLGVRGDGLERVAQRWQKEWGVRGELRRKVPDAILLSVGLNDIARVGRPDGRPQLSTEAFRFGFLQLLKEIKAETKVIVIGLTPVNEASMPFAEYLWYSNEFISIYEAQIEAACLNIDIPFLPIHKALLAEPELPDWINSDGIHLNSKGHLWIFKRIIKWSPLLELAGINNE